MTQFKISAWAPNGRDVTSIIGPISAGTLAEGNDLIDAPDRNRYSDEEDEIILRLRADGKTFSKIAGALGRKNSGALASVCNRYHHIVNRPTACKAPPWCAS